MKQPNVSFYSNDLQLEDQPFIVTAHLHSLVFFVCVCAACVLNRLMCARRAAWESLLCTIFFNSFSIDLLEYTSKCRQKKTDRKRNVKPFFFDVICGF